MPLQSPRVRRLSLEWVSVYTLCATIIIAAVLFIPTVTFPAVPTKAFIVAAGALVTLAVWILARLSRGNIIFPPAPLVLALWLPAVAYLLSAAFAAGPFGTYLWGTALDVDTAGFILALAGLGTLTALVVRRADHYHAFFRVFAIASGVFVALSAGIVVLGQFAPNLVAPSLSLVGATKDLAALLGLIIILVLLAVRFVELSPRTGKLLTGLGVAALVLLAVLNIQLIWILVALVSLGLFVEAIMTRRPGDPEDLEDVAMVADASPAQPTHEGSRSFLLPLVVLAISLFFLIGGTLGSALAGALHTGTLDVRPSWQSTLLVGKQVYSASPLFGSGPGSFGAEWLQYRDPAVNATVFWSVDFTSGIGFIPTSAVTTGVVGAVAWLLLIGLLLFYGVRMLVMRAPSDPFTQFASVASFIGTLYLLVVSFLDLPGPVVLALAFVFLGLFASCMRYAQGARQWGLAFARAPRLGFVIVFVLTLFLLGSVGAGYALVERYIAISLFSRASAAYAAGDLERAGNLAKASISFAPIKETYTLQALVANAKLSQLLTSNPPPADAQQVFQATISEGITAALTATKLAPESYQAWAALGNLYGQAVPLGVTGAYDSAKQAYDKAVALHPTSPQLHYVLAQLNLANKDGAAAESDLKQAIALKGDYTAAIFLLSQVLVASGNVKDALAAAEAAAYFTPKDPNVLFQVGVLRAAAGNLEGSGLALKAAVEANASFANARYFYAAVLAGQKKYAEAKAELEAIAALSEENAKAVAPAIATLEAGRNPFPPNLLTIGAPPVPAQTSPGVETSAKTAP